MANEVRFDKYILPINVYDIFGYFVPIITTVTCVLCFEHLGASIGGGKFQCVLLEVLKKTVPDSHAPSVLESLVMAAALICIIYAAGHINAAISSIFIDKLLIFRGHGYPYETILGISNRWHRDSAVSRLAIQGACFTMVVIIIIAYVKYFFNVTNTVRAFLAYFSPDYAKDLLSPYFLHNLSAVILKISSIYTIAIIIVILFEFVLYFHKEFGQPWRPCYVWCVEHSVFFPVVLATTLLSKTLHRKKRFPKHFVRDYEIAFRDTFGYEKDEVETNNYWFCDMYLADTAPELHKKATNWLSLYGFARNLCTALLLAFAYSTLVLILNFNFIDSYHESGEGSFFVLKCMPLLFFVMALIMLWRYYHLYSSYYSNFIFRAFVYLHKRSGKGGALGTLIIPQSVEDE